MEFLLANHPLDCPICDQGGECDLQDQSMRYGSDRTRFHEITGKRATENKNFGPLIKTSMNRCIHCTRCVRFANEVAGVQDLGTSGRGNDMQIGTYIEKTINSEMSGNIVDLCPVGALTSKPYAFEARPWELKHTESIDVLDAVGSNIRVDSRGVLVMRVEPRLNDDINEEWIHDKTRYAYDGLKTQRLNTPLIRRGDRFEPADWPTGSSPPPSLSLKRSPPDRFCPPHTALEAIKEGLASSGANGNEIQGVAGALADTESLVALKDFINRLGSDNTTLDQPLGSASPAHGVDFRSNYTFGSTIAGVEHADRILLIGTNPRHEAAIVNARIRKSWLRHETDLALIGQEFDSTFGYEHLGDDLASVQKVLGDKNSKWHKELQNAERPLIVVGSAIAEHEDGAKVLAEVAKFVEANAAKFVNEKWTGYSFLQRVRSLSLSLFPPCTETVASTTTPPARSQAASRTAAYDIGFTPSPAATETEPKFVYLLGADEFSPASIPRDAFVVYQGHHGDQGAQFADVVLPGAAYTEKAATWVNTEGRTQLGRAAVPPPGAAREDWKIVRALSEVVGATLPYDDTGAIRDRLWDLSPSLVRYGELERPTSVLEGLKALRVASERRSNSTTTTRGGRQGKFEKPIDNFYRTDVISRASVTMGHCTKAFVEGKTGADGDVKPISVHA